MVDYNNYIRKKGSYMNNQPKEIVSLREVCSVLKISITTGYRLLKAGKLKSFRNRKRGKHYFYLGQILSMNEVSPDV